MVRTLNATDGGDLAEVFGTVSGIEAIRQQVTQRLRFVAGEWIVNVEEGVPYFGEVLSLTPDVVTALEASRFRHERVHVP